MADDPKLIGYFYVDCPTWVHARHPELKKPFFDPELLDTESGRQQLFDMATRYYQVAREAIKRYDPNHLILGDRYEGKAPLPDEVLRAAVPYVDVMSFQCFSGPDEVCPDLSRWHALTGKPVLLADASFPGRNKGASASGYGDMMRALRELPSCVGWHLCGAYLQNRCRCYGLRDDRDQIIEPLVSTIQAVNRETHDWVAQGAMSSG